MFKKTKQYLAFTSYYNEYKNKVFSFMVYRLNDAELAEDLTADTFVKAYEHFDSYDDKYAFSTWIYKIARNTLIDHTRKNKATHSIEEAEHISDANNSEEKLINKIDSKDAIDTIKEKLHILPELQQECIILKYMDDMKNSEIAAITGESEANVRQALSRGTKKLKKYLSHILFTTLISIRNIFS